MRALEELRNEGRLGDAGATMLYACVRAVGRGRGFKPPSGHDRWSKDAIIELAHDFLADPRNRGRLAYLTINATDDESMERLLNTMVLNYLRDQGRRTEVGRLVRRINTVLTKDVRFETAHGRWSLTGGPSTSSTESPNELAHIADAVEKVTVPRWSDQTARAHPHADAASIALLCHTVLASAEGSLTAADLARAIAARVDLRPTPIVNLLDVPEPTDVSHSALIEANDDVVAARAVFDTLTDREKCMMATLHLPLREIFDATGVRKSQAATVRARVIAAVSEATAELPNCDLVRIHLHDIARGWLHDRTRGAGAAS